MLGIRIENRTFLKHIQAASCPDVKITVIKYLVERFFFVLLSYRLNSDVELPTI